MLYSGRYNDLLYSANYFFLRVYTSLSSIILGFRPVGSHIPAPAPLPKHVQRLLDHLAKVNKKEQQKN